MFCAALVTKEPVEVVFVGARRFVHDGCEHADCGVDTGSGAVR